MEAIKFVANAVARKFLSVDRATVVIGGPVACSPFKICRSRTVLSLSMPLPARNVRHIPAQPGSFLA
jgi:hypothetical protein